MISLLGVGFHAERNTESDGTTTALAVGVVAAMVLFGAVAVWALVREVLDIVKGKRNAGLAAGKRNELVVAHLLRETRDMDIELADAVAGVVDLLSSRTLRQGRSGGAVGVAPSRLWEDSVDSGMEVGFGVEESGSGSGDGSGEEEGGSSSGFSSV